MSILLDKNTRVIRQGFTGNWGRFRRCSALIATGFMLAAVTGGARADEMFDAFRQMCVSTHADEAQAIAAADRAGWMPIPQAMLDKFPKGNFDQPQGRMRSTNAGLSMLIVGSGKLPLPSDVKGRICAVASMPGDAAALEQQVSELAGVPKDKTTLTGGQTLYVWREENGAHIQVMRETPDLKSLVESGAVSFLMALSNEKRSMVMLVVPARTSKSETTAQ